MTPQEYLRYWINAVLAKSKHYHESNTRFLDAAIKAHDNETGSKLQELA